MMLGFGDTPVGAVTTGIPGPGAPGFVPYAPTASDVAAYQAQVTANSDAVVPGTASGEVAYQATQGQQGEGMQTPSVGGYNAPSTPAPAVATCFNPLSSLFPMDTCLGPLGLLEWLALVGIGFWAFGGKR